jgi:hypothetical protein
MPARQTSTIACNIQEINILAKRRYLFGLLIDRRYVIQSKSTAITNKGKQTA